MSGSSASARWGNGSSVRSTSRRSGSPTYTESASRSSVVANARDGFIHDARGLDLAAARAHRRCRSITEYPGARSWPSAIEGLRATDADSRGGDGEPIRRRRARLRAHARGAGARDPGGHLEQVARRAARRRARRAGAHTGVAFRAESTVMSGTPVLSTLVDGLAGAVPTGLRGLLNATANFILTRMAAGESYEDALAEAQRSGLAERDPAADVDGPDTVAKVMILSALVFRRQLRPDQVSCRGITDVARCRHRPGRRHRWTDQAPRDARLLRHGGPHRPRGTRARRPRRSAGPHRRDHQRHGLPSHPGRRGHDHRTRRRTATRGARRAQRPHRRRQIADALDAPF